MNMFQINNKHITPAPPYGTMVLLLLDVIGNNNSSSYPPTPLWYGVGWFWLSHGTIGISY